MQSFLELEKNGELLELTNRVMREKSGIFGCLLVPGGRVLNPQSYHSAFRISSTRHEKALAVQWSSITLISPESKS